MSVFDTILLKIDGVKMIKETCLEEIAMLYNKKCHVTLQMLKNCKNKGNQFVITLQ